MSQAGYGPGENHDVSFEASSTLRLAGHIDMLFFRCFCLQSLVSACCSGECCFFCRVTLQYVEMFFLIRVQCSVYLYHKLFSQLTVCTVEYRIYSIVSRSLRCFFIISCDLQSRAAYIHATCNQGRLTFCISLLYRKV